MKNYRKRNRLNKPLTVSLIVLILLGVIVAFLEISGRINLFADNNGSNPNNTGETINYIPTSEEEQRQIDETKTDIDNPQNKPISENPSSNSPEVTITSAAQLNDEVVIKTELQGTSWKSCNLTLTQGANKFERTAEVIFQEEFSTCAGFSIPLNDFSASGEWNASVTARDMNNNLAKSENVTFSVIK